MCNPGLCQRSTHFKSAFTKISSLFVFSTQFGKISSRNNFITHGTSDFSTEAEIQMFKEHIVMQLWIGSQAGVIRPNKVLQLGGREALSCWPLLTLVMLSFSICVKETHWLNSLRFLNNREKNQLEHLGEWDSIGKIHYQMASVSWEGKLVMTSPYHQGVMLKK